MPRSSPSETEWTIRRAVIDDARAIAEVHVESWKSTYRGILPAGLLDSLTVEMREPIWRDMLAAGGLSATITLAGCDASGKIVAFVSGGKERTGQLGCDGEVYALYLRQEVQRRGLGSLLVREFVRELVSSGAGSMAVWVLALNPAAKFYESLGGTLIGQQEIERGGQAFLEVAYGWQSLDRLISM